MNKKLLLLLFCVFVVSIGFGVALPVLPFYAKHLHAAGVPRETMAIHIGLLTSVYALMQFIFAPFWGQRSDRVGRRPLILLGIAGSAITQVLFGFATSLGMLYVVRAVGGFLSSAALPAATAYVSDLTTESDRSRGMAWLGTAVSLGVIAGPAFGGLTTREDIHLAVGFVDFKIEKFAPPFFLSAVLMLLILAIAMRWLPESLPSRAVMTSSNKLAFRWRQLESRLLLLLVLTSVAQFGLTIFEATFALYAQEKLGYGPVQTGIVFMICGLVMAVFQIIAVGYFSNKMNAVAQIASGLSLMGIGIILLLLVRNMLLVFGVVGLLALGMALVTPNLSALISKRSGQHTGKVLGMQNAANSLGQVGGPMLGGVLFAWRPNAPYLFAGAFLVSVSLGVIWQAKSRRH
ncbi:MFS transporter [Chroococcidiopsis sp. FACHB-1243]|uniref:MFS transporter n=1 Tax=Chroococcidiopsis sp. [FACHB-1243] TaxID=2692781 RepID=UPI000D05FE38|nr:MFS transporter [Chroococcidiopsis sp. [FACHB-1243]]MBD2307314.1 MFS transporter [Chroococcidiopsis sp. [FACHB-1243]]PSB48936.1 MFS transporter [Cyanosarcina cf. burmensis CCALA 770]